MVSFASAGQSGASVSSARSLAANSVASLSLRRRAPGAIDELVGVGVAFFVGPPFLGLVGGNFTRGCGVSPVFTLGVGCLAVGEVVRVSLLVSAMSLFLVSGAKYIRGRKCCGRKRRDVVSLVYSVA